MSKSKTTITYLMVVITILLLSCTSRESETSMVGDIFDEANLPAAEKQIWKAMNIYDSNQILALTDSLEKTGEISAITACYYRGAAAANKGMLEMAEEHLKKATDRSALPLGPIKNGQPEAADLRAYLKSRALLSRILASESDYQGALNEALPTLAMMDSLGNKDYGDITQLRIVIGECQQHLRMPANAATNFAYAYVLMLTLWAKICPELFFVSTTLPPVISTRQNMRRPRCGSKGKTLRWPSIAEDRLLSRNRLIF